jgi:hypothetical protein
MNCLRSLERWVRIPLKAWMSVCIYSVCAVLCVDRDLADLQRADPPSKESYRLCIGLRNWKSGQGPTKGCRAIDRKNLNITDMPLNRHGIWVCFMFIVSSTNYCKLSKMCHYTISVPSAEQCINSQTLMQHTLTKIRVSISHTYF